MLRFEKLPRFRLDGRRDGEWLDVGLNQDGTLHNPHCYRDITELRRAIMRAAIERAKARR
jgi:hypothetical protein